jgi:hypothetical protein
MSPLDILKLRRRVLAELGGDASSIEQVLRYNENRFDIRHVPPPPVFPLPDELHVADWRAYADACGKDVLTYMRERLVQLNIPIRAGVSATPEYADVVRRGKSFCARDFGGQLTLEMPEELRLALHEHPAGTLPILLTRHRPDFVALEQVLAFRNEPTARSQAVSARLISGLINWDRVRRYQQAWLAGHVIADSQAWSTEQQRVAAAEPARFYDRLVLACVAPYSGVAASALGLEMDDATWLDVSTAVRLEHEFTHYTSLRLFGKMNLNLLDEILCDWAGITAALGRFEARWFITMLGLEDWPAVAPGARFNAYCTGLNGDAVHLLGAVTIRAAQGLEEIAKQSLASDRQRILLSVSQMTLELLACADRHALFAYAYAVAGQLLGVP